MDSTREIIEYIDEDDGAPDYSALSEALQLTEADAADEPDEGDADEDNDDTEATSTEPTPHELNAIVCVDASFGIGKNGTIPWRIKEDLQFFYKTTVGHVVIMGRTTFFSIDEQYRPLKNRVNIVLTRNPTNAEYQEISHKHPNVFFVDHIDFNELDHFTCEQFPFLLENWNYFVIGGAFVYNLFIGNYNRLYMTHVYDDYECDTRLNTNIFVNKFDARKIVEEGENYHIMLYSNPIQSAQLGF